MSKLVCASVEESPKHMINLFQDKFLANHKGSKLISIPSEIQRKRHQESPLIASSEFQSLILESVAYMDMDNRPNPSGKLASLVERGAELSRHCPEELQKEETEEHSEAEPEVFLEGQTKFFDQLKVFLTAQQISLRQNLILLETKASRLTEQKNDDINRRNPEDNCLADPAQKVQESRELEALRQWGSPVEDDVQICPVCGIDFDTGANENALEEHVVGHWCSASDSEAIL